MLRPLEQLNFLTRISLAWLKANNSMIPDIPIPGNPFPGNPLPNITFPDIPIPGLPLVSNNLRMKISL